jgi:hypothetical protein
MKTKVLLAGLLVLALTGCGQLGAPATANLARAAHDDDTRPFYAVVDFTAGPENPECVVFPQLIDCRFKGTSSGDLKSRDYRSVANGTLGVEITAIHTVKGRIPGVGFGTLQGIVKAGDGTVPGTFHFRGIGGDFDDEVRVAGAWLEPVVGVFEFVLDGTLYLDWDDDDDDDDEDDDD